MVNPDFSFDRAVILGATGPTGIHLAAALRGRGVGLRVVSRNSDNLERLFGAAPDERFAADAMKPDEVARAIEGYPVVFDCIGLPAELLDKHPVIAKNVARAIQATGARCMQVSSFWAYLPAVRNPITEDHPRTGGCEWVRYRREAENIRADAGAAVLHLPDFYGPHVHDSTLQQPLSEAVQGKAMNWIGGRDTEREYVYVPDAMEVAARAAFCSEAYGQRWIVPGSGPISGAQVAELAGEVLGRKVGLRCAGPTLLRVVSLFNRQLRGFMQMVPEYLKPIAYDASKLRKLIGPVDVTPYETGIGETLRWIQSVQE